ncbi:hypothetical protein BCO71171_00242 [Burkholderia contaminans]|uniref:Uncharacterized protein n=1 Tax=Burkholderia contaminans TaxID=488447 RepID=A0A6P2V9N4_9BURK|nr:hypothetical protein BCO71171_00242 [Burkholderia contaminans]
MDSGWRAGWVGTPVSMGSRDAVPPRPGGGAAVELPEPVTLATKPAGIRMR